MQQLLLGSDGLCAPYYFVVGASADDGAVSMWISAPAGMRHGTTYTATATPGGRTASVDAVDPAVSGLPLSITGLNNGTTYEVYVTARNRLGEVEVFVGSSFKPSAYNGESVFGMPTSITRKVSYKYNGSAYWAFFMIGPQMYTNTSATEAWRSISTRPEKYEVRVDALSGAENLTTASIPLGTWVVMSDANIVMEIRRVAAGTATAVLSVQVRRRYEDQAVVASTTVTITTEIT